MPCRHCGHAAHSINACVECGCDPYAGKPGPRAHEPSSYNVRSTEVEAALRRIAGLIKPEIPQGFGFTLMIFSYGKTGLPNEGPEGAMFYISTGDRQDMIKAMQEFIAKHTH